MFKNDNTILLIILIGIILLIILNMNSSNKEYFDIPKDLTSKNSNSAISNSILPIQNNNKQLITNQNNNQQLINNNKNNKQNSIGDYMLLDTNVPTEEKFLKVTPSDVRKTLLSSDLLPKEENDDWFQNPNSKFNLMDAVQLEIPEIKIGIDTVGQSRKNATYDLRSAPPNPKFVVSPWSNSTIEPDYNTKPLC